MKTFDIIAKKWFDKLNGNTYFSARVTLDFGTTDAQVFYVPFSYGYESIYYESINLLVKLGLLPESGRLPEGVIIREFQLTGTKKEIKLWGAE